SLDPGFPWWALAFLATAVVIVLVTRPRTSAAAGSTGVTDEPGNTDEPGITDDPNDDDDDGGLTDGLLGR
ncbi:hypothetical protein SB748_30155, partial [Rhizobium sp. SIMBA_035]